MSLKPRGFSLEEMSDFIALYKGSLSIRRAAESMAWSYYRGQRAFVQAVEKGLIEKPVHAIRGGGQQTNEERKRKDPPPLAVAGRLDEREVLTAVPEHREGVTRFILSCAQNNPHVHEQVWTNLQAMAKTYGARIILARTVYNRFSDSSNMDKKLIIAGQGG